MLRPHSRVSRKEHGMDRGRPVSQRPAPKMQDDAPDFRAAATDRTGPKVSARRRHLDGRERLRGARSRAPRLRRPQAPELRMGGVPRGSHVRRLRPPATNRLAVGDGRMTGRNRAPTEGVESPLSDEHPSARGDHTPEGLGFFSPARAVRARLRRRLLADREPCTMTTPAYGTAGIRDSGGIEGVVPRQHDLPWT